MNTETTRPNIDIVPIKVTERSYDKPSSFSSSLLSTSKYPPVHSRKSSIDYSSNRYEDIQQIRPAAITTTTKELPIINISSTTSPSSSRDRELRSWLRWCNLYLNLRNESVTSLNIDNFQDGTNLLHLLEICTKESISPFYLHPENEQQKQANSQTALNYLYSHDMLTNEDLIETNDILYSTHNINRYEMRIISILNGILRNVIINILQLIASQVSQSSNELPVFDMLCFWINSLISNIDGAKQIKTFEINEFNDGIALAAVVNSLEPNCIDVAALNNEESLDNIETALKMAEIHLGIIAPFTANDLYTSSVDEDVLMSYIFMLMSTANIPKEKRRSVRYASIVTLPELTQTTETTSTRFSDDTQADTTSANEFLQDDVNFKKGEVAADMIEQNASTAEKVDRAADQVEAIMEDNPFARKLPKHDIDVEQVTKSLEIQQKRELIEQGIVDARDISGVSTSSGSTEHDISAPESVQQLETIYTISEEPSQSVIMAGHQSNEMISSSEYHDALNKAFTERRMLIESYEERLRNDLQQIQQLRQRVQQQQRIIQMRDSQVKQLQGNSQIPSIQLNEPFAPTDLSSLLLNTVNEQKSSKELLAEFPDYSCWMTKDSVKLFFYLHHDALYCADAPSTPLANCQRLDLSSFHVIKRGNELSLGEIVGLNVVESRSISSNESNGSNERISTLSLSHSWLILENEIYTIQLTPRSADPGNVVRLICPDQQSAVDWTYRLNERIAVLSLSPQSFVRGGRELAAFICDPVARVLRIEHKICDLSILLTDFGEVLKYRSEPIAFILRQCAIDDQAVEALAEILSVNHAVEWVDLTGNMITATGCQYLAQALTTNDTLRAIVLDHNEIGDQGVLTLCDGLVEHPMAALSLRNVNLTDHGGQQLIRRLSSMLPENSRIGTFDLSCNPLVGDQTCTSLASALLPSCTIGQINLSWNSSITDQGILALSAALIVGAGVDHIDISHLSKLTDISANALADVLNVGSAEDLTINISDCPGISSHGMAALINSGTALSFRSFCISRSTNAAEQWLIQDEATQTEQSYINIGIRSAEQINDNIDNQHVAPKLERSLSIVATDTEKDTVKVITAPIPSPVNSIGHSVLDEDTLSAHLATHEDNGVHLIRQRSASSDSLDVPSITSAQTSLLKNGKTISPVPTTPTSASTGTQSSPSIKPTASRASSLPVASLERRRSSMFRMRSSSSSSDQLEVPNTNTATELLVDGKTVNPVAPAAQPL